MSNPTATSSPARTEQPKASATATTPKAGVPARRPGAALASGHASLSSEQGQTRISASVVSKIAGMAAREIPGVYQMGRGMARRMGQLRAMMPGTTDAGAATQGVSVEVGAKETAIDLDVVTWYGQSIVEITEAVRRNVIDRVEGMAGLKVVEVNIDVDDIYVEGEEPAEGQPEPRVQ